MCTQRTALCNEAWPATTSGLPTCTAGSARIFSTVGSTAPGLFLDQRSAFLTDRAHVGQVVRHDQSSSVRKDGVASGVVGPLAPSTMTAAAWVSSSSLLTAGQCTAQLQS